MLLNPTFPKASIFVLHNFFVFWLFQYFKITINYSSGYNFYLGILGFYQ